MKAALYLPLLFITFLYGGVLIQNRIHTNQQIRILEIRITALEDVRAEQSKTIDHLLSLHQSQIEATTIMQTEISVIKEILNVLSQSPTR